ncbi:hypothetical protein EHS13_20300 [Paenibacillus psychroresistens]|uniref:Uncharacterized protein n=1 Tax=Paenibacillus psychroresistens TaxID=1778678 RepID=A0A6B8RKZ2_9BACL|nr:hypothetical protein [Paenibacillus psychroresistens]QGQ97061.1 hypothetical protein EHS13_20300 [Paenibacillus psychroresistens]
MIDNTILEAIESFCKTHVSPKIMLMVPNDDDVSQYNLMYPNVFVGWIPPPNQLEDVPLQLPEGLKSAIPAIVIGMDEAEDDGNDAGLNIRISFIVYNPGLYPEPGTLIPNFKGYKDLLNLIFICRQQLSSHYLIEGGKTAAQKPFRWGMYLQQPAGYYVGWLTFRATATILPFMDSPNYIID